jgi:hypothetical protein
MQGGECKVFKIAITLHHHTSQMQGGECKVFKRAESQMLACNMMPPNHSMTSDANSLCITVLIDESIVFAMPSHCFQPVE